MNGVTHALGGTASDDLEMFSGAVSAFWEHILSADLCVVELMRLHLKPCGTDK